MWLIVFIFFIYFFFCLWSQKTESFLLVCLVSNKLTKTWGNSFSHTETLRNAPFFADRTDRVKVRKALIASQADLVDALIISTTNEASVPKSKTRRAECEMKLRIRIRLECKLAGDRIQFCNFVPNNHSSPTAWSYLDIINIHSMPSFRRYSMRKWPCI